MSDGRSTYPALDDSARAEVRDKLVDIVVLRHGGRLSPEQLTELRRRLDHQLSITETLHSFRLVNEQEPFFVARTTGSRHE